MQAQAADGTIHEFPDGTDIAVIDRVMKQYAASSAPVEQAAPPAVNPRVPEFAISPEGQAPAPTQQSPAMRGLQVGAQGAGAGLAELVSMPFDLAAGGQIYSSPASTNCLARKSRWRRRPARC